jgi:hypothetical protein
MGSVRGHQRGGCHQVHINNNNKKTRIENHSKVFIDLKSLEMNDKNTDSVYRYKLEMSSDNGVSWQPLKSSIDGLSYMVKNVAPLNGYRFRVAASNLYSSRCGALGGICGQSPWITTDIINAMSGSYFTLTKLKKKI